MQFRRWRRSVAPLSHQPVTVPLVRDISGCPQAACVADSQWGNGTGTAFRPCGHLKVQVAGLCSGCHRHSGPDHDLPLNRLGRVGPVPGRGWFWAPGPRVGSRRPPSASSGRLPATVSSACEPTPPPHPPVHPCPARRSRQGWGWSVTPGRGGGTERGRKGREKEPRERVREEGRCRNSFTDATCSWARGPAGRARGPTDRARSPADAGARGPRARPEGRRAGPEARPGALWAEPGAWWTSGGPGPGPSGCCPAQVRGRGGDPHPIGLRAAGTCCL